MKTENKSNRLANEISPYLLQHAHNPVDWYPWGDEAFEKAKAENKPVFLSIGYSTCHWCHVMEAESFEDQEVAHILNENYISIKVDRELRPDIDNLYMRVCQAMTGSGGWPMSVFMTPEQKPFFVGTYFPKKSSGQYPGFIDVINHFAEVWKTNKNHFLKDISHIETFLKQSTSKSSEELSQNVIKEAFDELKSQYDPLFGGLGNAPKFPTPHKLFFLLRYYKSTSDQFALDMVEHTLLSMYKGGIFDHIGYGFSRYSTDNKWLVPHFEKMLYDNALLSIAYTECFACTKNKLYKDIAEKIFTYVLRDLTSSDNAFYSAEDADSEGVEGKYYIWSYKELFKQFNKKKMDLLCTHFGVTEEGNFENSNILNLIHTDLETMNQPDNKKALEEIRSRLYDERLKRIRPFKDTKILTSWNGMMIAALAIGGRVLHRRDYIVAAKKAASFILHRMTDRQNRLLNGYKDGIHSTDGYLDDYAYIIFGFIELYRSTFDPIYLKKALEYNQVLIDNFWDHEKSGFFFYGNDHEKLLIRPKEHYDGATPSGNSVSAMNLLQLYEYTGEYSFKARAEELLKAFGEDINNQPGGHIHFITAFLTNNQNKSQVIFTCKDKNQLLKIRQKLDSNFLPFTTLLVYDGNEAAVESLPQLKNYMPEDQVTAYVCENFICQQPTNNLDAVFTRLQ